MENRRINFFSRIGKSISADIKFYLVILKESLGKSIGFLVLFALLISILSCIKPVYETRKGIQFIMNYFESEIPYFELKNGELQVNGDMPIVFEEGSTIIVVDTTNQIDESILNEYEQGFLLTKTKMMSKQGIKKEEYNFSEFGQVQFDKDDIQGFIPILKTILIPIVILGIILGTIIGKLFSSLFVSLIGLIVNSVLNGHLKYGDIYKLGIYSMTLPSIIKFVLKLFPVQVPFFGFIFFLIYYGIVVWYLSKAVGEIKISTEEFEKSMVE